MSDTPMSFDDWWNSEPKDEAGIEYGLDEYHLLREGWRACITNRVNHVERENAALRSDIERHVKIASDLATELEQVRKDAERYRHLRDHGGADLFGGTASMSIGKHPMIVYFAPSLNHANMVSLFAENADYMVDAAIAQGKGEK